MAATRHKHINSVYWQPLALKAAEAVADVIGAAAAAAVRRAAADGETNATC